MFHYFVEMVVWCIICNQTCLQWY